MRSSNKDQDAAAAARMISENRDFFRQRGFHLMIWGMLLSGLFSVHAAVAFGYLSPAPGLAGWLWVATVIVAVLVSFLFERYHATNPVNILSRTLVHLWSGLGVALVLIGFLGGATMVMPTQPHSGALAAVIGAGFFISAMLVESRGVLWLGLLWWCAGAALFFLSAPAAVFLMACLSFGGLFLPGLALYWTARVNPVSG